jgi:hypothetical protein
MEGLMMRPLSENVVGVPSTTIPKLYETENIPIEEKIVHQRYQIKEIHFFWLIVELDRKENLAFGYANLDNDSFAEWGYISIAELLVNGATLDRDWKACKFSDALKKISAEKEKEEERKGATTA